MIWAPLKCLVGNEPGFGAGKVIGGVCHGPLGLLLAKDENGAPLVKGCRLTAVTDKQVQELGITMTPQHPERELRAAGARIRKPKGFPGHVCQSLGCGGPVGDRPEPERRS